MTRSEPSGDRFGPLLSITPESLVSLASKIRYQVFGEKTSQGRLLARLNGSYNLIHIVQLDDSVKYVIRVPAAGWGNRFTNTAKRALESQALTMRLIRSETNIPLPEVYHFETTGENEIGAPYIAMSFINGYTVSSKWFDKTGPTPLETRRLRTLTTLAKAMAQLRKFRFNKIGSLQFDGNANSKITIGPCYDWNVDDDDGVTVKAVGPFSTSRSYLLDDFDDPEEDDPYAVGAHKLTSIMVPYLPSPRKGSETFALRPPDFDSQNIMIDERGNLTGIIDWDNVQTFPSFIGYSRFPGWITRDWDPLMYGWPKLDEENSPAELTRYRKHYNQEMKGALGRKGDWKLTKKSHIFEAVCIAAQTEMCRLEITRKFVQYAFRNVEDFNALDFIIDVGEGKEDGCKKFEKMVRSLILLSGKK
jgi:hypothetical protein